MGRSLAERGPEEAKNLLLPHWELIFRCAYRMSGRRADAEDLAQETFYFAIKNFSQLKDSEKVKNWLFSILRNLFLKEIQKNKKRIHIDYDSISHTLGGVTNLEKEILQADTGHSIRAMLDSLENRLRLPIEMFYYERKSYKEIAHELSLPIGTVMSRIARGKVYLKRKLNRVGYHDI